MAKTNVVILKDIQMYIDKCKNKSISVQILRSKNPNIVSTIYWMAQIGNVEQLERIQVNNWNYNTEQTIEAIKQIK